MTQLINNHILPNELSIHFFENGFSFCTNSKINFNPIISDKEDLKVLLKENLDFYPKGSFEVYSVVFFQSPSTFVPQKFFDPKKIEIYLSLYKKTNKKDVFTYDIIENQNQVNVYSYQNEIKFILDETEIKFNYTHYNSILYKKILSVCSFVEFKYQLFIHIQFEAIDIFLVNNNSIIFHNRFSVKNEEEFLYYVFFIVEQFDLKSNDFEIIFLGKFIEYNSYYEIISQFHNMYKFITNDSPFSIDQSNHHAPFLATYSS